MAGQGIRAEDWLLAGEWSEALGADVDVAFYAHHLHRGTAQGAQDDPSSLEPGAQELLVDWTELLRPGLSIPQGPRTARARQAVDWITRNFGAAARVFAIAFCREVHTYLSTPDSPRRAAVRRTVADAITQRRPNVIVAHSLGSVVTYETLWAHQDHDVDLLITIGSPLAIPRTGLREHFDGVERDITVVIGEWDFHTATAYLRNPEVAALFA
ncbi:hypothetical protein ALI22I_31270 [Saccharothrix sp. ALI-22-I]|uniref:hypothetical protein n=1 Tax=Saccharothrix sp. ALI-22-I TaxID=1933778 RepID=UPI00097C32D8|nr:hypothetical protein [Saccharothrix sp. ALI-22-I]ONI84944.1 hypothetical protein ALI22I_31270 [Saccharothrix sp. ALI-22-I]